jgi:spermidine/putrescine transport system substrate-binding protein
MTDPFRGINDPITRRQLLRRAAAGGATLSLPALLAACGGGGIEGESADTSAVETQVTRELADRLVFANWPLYVDVDEDSGERPTLARFTEETGVEVEYIEEVNDNDEWFGKYQAQLSAGQDIGRDLVVLTDWMAARMVRLGYVQRIDREAIPNVSNLEPALASPGWDPNREYSLPWQSGLTGIAYNPALTGGPVTTVEQLFTDPSLRGRVSALTEMPDTMGIIIAANGDDPENVTPEAFDRAIDTLQSAVDSGQIRRFTGNDYADDLAAGNIHACIAWSGDIVQLQLDNPDLEFTIVDTGSHLWTDNMLIPNGGDVYTASTYMNFVYQPDVAAEIEAYVNFICPVVGARDALMEIDPELAENELIFPTEEMIANTFIFDAEASDNPDFKEQFQAVIGA